MAPLGHDRLTMKHPNRRLFTIPVLSLLLPLAAADDPAPYSCGPFLLGPGTDTMTIVIDHVSPVAATLEWGPVGGEGSVVEHAAMRHHIFALEGLEPDREYAYAITTVDELSSGARTFRTLPLAPESYRLVALGDVRSQPKEWERVARRVLDHEREALFVIGTGDYPADGRMYAQWIEQFFVPARDLLGRIPLWPAIGNHERTREASDATKEELSHFFSLFELPGNERWYRVDYELMTLLVLDSNSHVDPSAPQYAWLLSELRSLRGRFTLVAFHHAPFTSGPHGRSHADGTPFEWPLDEGRRFLAPLFEMYGVDLVLNGHDHLYERSQKDGVVYVVTGGGGAPLYPIDTVPNRYQERARSAHHYVALDVSREAIEVEAIDVEGEVFDRATIAVKDTSLARRHYFLSEQLESGVTLGAYDPEANAVPYTITNELSEALEVTCQVSDGGGRREEVSFTLAPGETRSSTVDLAGAEPGAEPWRAPHVAKLEWLFESRDQTLDVRVEHATEVVLGRPFYPVGAMNEPTLDGDLAEWTGVSAIEIDEHSPVVQRPTAHTGRDDCSAQVRFARSDTHLFVAATVTDDVVADKEFASLFRNDAVHVLFAGASEVEAGVEKMELTTHSMLFTGTIRSSGGAGARGAGTQRDGGYQVEAAIPLASLPLGADGRIGFDIVVSDRDEGPRATSLLRAYSEHRKRDDPSQFGLLHLGRR